MANKRYDQFTAGTAAGTDITLFANPSTGALKKTTISSLIPVSYPIAPFVQLGKLFGWNIINTANSFNWFDYGTTNFMVNQQASYTAIYLPDCTATGIQWFKAVAAAYTPNNFNGAALYSFNNTSTLTQVAISANSSTGWTTASAIAQFPFTSTIALSAGIYYIALLYCFSAKTQDPVFKGITGHGSELSSLLPVSYLPSFAVPSQTTLPSTQTLTGVVTGYSPAPCTAVY